MSELKNIEDLNSVEPVKGFRAKYIHSENMTIAFWDIEKGAELAEHSHENEQISCCMDGEFELTVDGNLNLMQPGDIVVIPSGVKHSGKAVKRTRMIDTFNPARRDFDKL